MVRFLFLGLFLITSGQILNADVPSACRACLSECPHVTRDIKACDNNCPGLCSAAQVKEYKSRRQACVSCMSGCPHRTRHFEACDAGCPEVCTAQEAADILAKKQANACKECMAECPHVTKDYKPCDRGCPEVCPTKQDVLKSQDRGAVK